MNILCVCSDNILDSSTLLSPSMLTCTLADTGRLPVLYLKYDGPFVWIMPKTYVQKPCARFLIFLCRFSSLVTITRCLLIILANKYSNNISILQSILPGKPTLMHMFFSTWFLHIFHTKIIYKKHAQDFRFSMTGRLYVWKKCSDCQL